MPPAPHHHFPQTRRCYDAGTLSTHTYVVAQANAA